MEQSPVSYERLDADNDDSLGRILVFTSKQCPFCGEALRLAKEAASRLHYYSKQLEVVETRIENSRDVLDYHRITAIPTIKIGPATLTGLPKVEDVEQVIHEMMLTDKLNAAMNP
jgi:hypothetical protein